MHDTAHRIGGLFVERYMPPRPGRILEIGSQNVNGSLRDHAPRNAHYVGLDFEAGEGVDKVVTGVDDWDVEDGSFDLVMASSVFEHDQAFWRTFEAMCSKAADGGHLYVSAPSNGKIHRYPKDYWRFYPDAGLALEEWGRSQGLDVTLVESFTAEREADVWNDFCAIFRVRGGDRELNTDFVHEQVACANVITWRSNQILLPAEFPEDMRLIAGGQEEVERWKAHADHVAWQADTREEEWQAERERLSAEADQVDGLRRDVADHRTRIADREAELDAHKAESARREVEVKQLMEGAERAAEAAAGRETLMNDLAKRERARAAEVERLTVEQQADRSRLAELDGALSDRRAEVDGLKAEAARLAVEVERRARQADAAATEREAQVAKATELEQRANDLKSRLAQRDEEAEQAWAEVKRLGEERDRLHATVQLSQDKVVEANSWVERLALHRTQSERRIRQLSRALEVGTQNTDEQVERVQRLEEELERTKADRIAAADALEGARQRLADAANDHAQVLETGRRDLAEAKNELATMRETLAKTAGSHSQSRESDKRDLMQARTSLSELRETLSSSKADGDSVRGRLTTITADLANRSDALEQAYAEMAAISRMLVAAQDSQAQLERQNDWLRAVGTLLVENDAQTTVIWSRARLRARRDQALRENGLFDAADYAFRYPDVVASGQEPLRHLLKHGLSENRHLD